jgi:hypothetical protein
MMTFLKLNCFKDTILERFIKISEKNSAEVFCVEGMGIFVVNLSKLL